MLSLMAEISSHGLQMTVKSVWHTNTHVMQSFILSSVSFLPLVLYFLEIGNFIVSSLHQKLQLTHTHTKHKRREKKSVQILLRLLNNNDNDKNDSSVCPILMPSNRLSGALCFIDMNNNHFLCNSLAQVHLIIVVCVSFYLMSFILLVVAPSFFFLFLWFSSLLGCTSCYSLPSVFPFELLIVLFSMRLPVHLCWRGELAIVQNALSNKTIYVPLTATWHCLVNCWMFLFTYRFFLRIINFFTDKENHIDADQFLNFTIEFTLNCLCFHDFRLFFSPLFRSSLLNRRPSDKILPWENNDWHAIM